MTSKKIIGGQPIPPMPDISFGQLLLDSLRKHSDKLLFVDAETDESQTNGYVLERAVKLATVLESRGIKCGDRISTACENHQNWLVVNCATMFVGAVLAPFNPTYTEWELQHILRISKPRIVFVSRRCEAVYLKLAKTLPWRMDVIELDDAPLDPNVPTLKQMLDKAKPVDPYRYQPAKIQDPAKEPTIILCSSGTTGLPKGVALSHRNVLSFLANGVREEFLNIQENDRFVVFLPFYHGYAFGLISAAITRGAALIVLRSFNLDLYLRTIPRYRITHLSLVPPVLILLMKHPAGARCDYSSVREIVCGAAPLPTDLVTEAQKRLNNRPIRNGYGMTELSVITNLSGRSDDVNGTVGRVWPGLLCKVIDQQTREPLGAGQIGEICFKGVQVMLGYYDNPKATAETIDKDGWLHTGDLGYFDQTENLYVVGRHKEVIKYKGFQVSPSEVETALLTHPGVKDAAVVGKSDEESGELPMAFIVKQAGVNVTAEDIVQFVRGKLSPQKWLRGGVRFIDDIPKNATGKILRKQLLNMINKL